MGWLAVFFGASTLIALTPGANNLLGMHHGMGHGFGKAIVGLLGRLAAFVLLIAAVAAGLGQLLAAWEPALTIVKWVGVAYLVYLGIRVLIEARRLLPAKDEPVPAGTTVAIARKEFLVAITNPKAVLIFTAFVPQFIDPAHGPVPAQVALLGAVYLLAEFLAGTVYIVVGTLVNAARMSLRARRNIDRGTGVVLLGMAGLLAGSRT
ncbi:LysE family translocator [Amycolatopsis magusensis]|uniref:Threonine/homoserine/homoserine lactone efflux protein n=1 Tax=Amycolatopsis magusensis TaxID=882444 RepID=A0ABS4PNI3_9PSEU|nr:LysE family translocator [Amycolatopsis magusensis]MBP2180470.1 threonine/homoserine/homoserine lactone efflux protein [Amycolatopsis magusensis]MDI5976819.1 LysE family translocator [Amycolatopsis magusensis]